MPGNYHGIARYAYTLIGQNYTNIARISTFINFMTVIVFE